MKPIMSSSLPLQDPDVGFARFFMPLSGFLSRGPNGDMHLSYIEAHPTCGICWYKNGTSSVANKTLRLACCKAFVEQGLLTEITQEEADQLMVGKPAENTPVVLITKPDETSIFRGEQWGSF